MGFVEDRLQFNDLINATTTKLSELKLKKNEELEMKYDYGSTTTFVITFTDQRVMNDFEGYLYPIITDGARC